MPTRGQLAAEINRAVEILRALRFRVWDLGSLYMVRDATDAVDATDAAVDTLRTSLAERFGPESYLREAVIDIVAMDGFVYIETFFPERFIDDERPDPHDVMNALTGWCDEKRLRLRLYDNASRVLPIHEERSLVPYTLLHLAECVVQKTAPPSLTSLSYYAQYGFVYEYEPEPSVAFLSAIDDAARDAAVFLLSIKEPFRHGPLYRASGASSSLVLRHPSDPSGTLLRRLPRVDSPFASPRPVPNGARVGAVLARAGDFARIARGADEGWVRAAYLHPAAAAAAPKTTSPKKKAGSPKKKAGSPTKTSPKKKATSPKKSSPKKKAGSPTKPAASFDVATYNLLNSPATGSVGAWEAELVDRTRGFPPALRVRREHLPWTARLPRLVAALRGGDGALPEVLLLQETSPRMFASLAARAGLDPHAHVRSAVGCCEHREGFAYVAWDPRAFELAGAVAAPSAAVRMAAARLRHRATGRVWTVASVHLPASGDVAAARDAVVRALRAAAGADAASVVVGGDFNVESNVFAPALRNVSGDALTFLNDVDAKFDWIVASPDVRPVAGSVRVRPPRDPATRWPDAVEGSDHTCVRVSLRA